MTTTARVTKLPECDLCKNENPDYTPEKAQYDGKTRYGIWGYMCERHFQTDGIGLGLGKGQLLITESPHTQHETNKADQLCQQCGKDCPVKSINKEELRYRLLDQPITREVMLDLGLYCVEVVNF